MKFTVYVHFLILIFIRYYFHSPPLPPPSIGADEGFCTQEGGTGQLATFAFVTAGSVDITKNKHYAYCIMNIFEVV